MKIKSLILLSLTLAALSGCVTQPQAARPAMPPESNIRATVNPVYCPTDNDQAKSHYNNGQLLTEKGLPEEAVKSYRKAIELDPGYCDAMDNLGRLLRQLGRLDEAAQWYKKSIEILPDNDVAHGNLGLVYQFQQKYVEAIAEYKIVVKFHPENPEGYYGLGCVYYEMNQLQLALENFNKAEQLYAKNSSPVIIDAQLQLGRTYFRLKDYRSAIKYLEQVIPKSRNNPEANYFLAYSYMIENNETEANKYFKRALELGYVIRTSSGNYTNLTDPPAVTFDTSGWSYTTIANSYILTPDFLTNAMVSVMRTPSGKQLMNNRPLVPSSLDVPALQAYLAEGLKDKKDAKLSVETIGEYKAVTATYSDGEKLGLEYAFEFKQHLVHVICLANKGGYFDAGAKVARRVVETFKPLN